jgi:hypothetical protein
MKLPGGEGLNSLQKLALYATIFGGTASGVNYLIQIIHSLG